MLEHTRSFGVTTREEFKQITIWWSHYHTSRNPWYPKPDSAIYHHIPLHKLFLRRKETEIMKGRAAAFGSAVRQRAGKVYLRDMRPSDPQIAVHNAKEIVEEDDIISDEEV